MLPRSPLEDESKFGIDFYHAQEHLMDCRRGDPSIPLPSAAWHHQTNCRSLRAAFLGVTICTSDMMAREKKQFFEVRAVLWPWRIYWTPGFRSSECCAEQIKSEKWHTKQGMRVMPDARNPARVRTCEKHTPPKNRLLARNVQKITCSRTCLLPHWGQYTILETIGWSVGNCISGMKNENISLHQLHSNKGHYVNVLRRSILVGKDIVLLRVCS